MTFPKQIQVQPYRISHLTSPRWAWEARGRKRYFFHRILFGLRGLRKSQHSQLKKIGGIENSKAAQKD